jgi:flavin reductase (DIM6/NTAB) family NADH-FMN oxidoreductase RutF
MSIIFKRLLKKLFYLCDYRIINLFSIMLKIDPQTTSVADFYQFMIAAVAPRPIAFVSTVDDEGNANLAPYSFFNAFSSNPPVVVFSAGRRVQDGTIKDTLSNIEDTMECVINMVSYNIARQMTLTSVNYPKGTSEFVKAGLTPIASDLVKPMRVKESPVQMECQVSRIIPLGTEGGAGHLIICNVVRMHINENVMDAEKKRIDPQKIDLVGRLGRSFYTRTTGNATFEMVQPERPLVIGFDGLPKSIRTSEVLTGNNIAQIGSLIQLPTKEDVLAIKKDNRIQKALFSGNILRGLHLLAQEELQKGNTDLGTKIALLGEYL